MKENTPRRRHPVRVECPNCACGNVGHMTADELKERAAHEDVDLSCPVCGMIHLSREEINELESHRLVDSKRYAELKHQAEGGN